MKPYDLAKSNSLLGFWLIAKTPVNRRYPCRCRRKKECDPRWCPCAGRVDLDGLPTHCCAPVNTPAVAAAAHGVWVRPVPGPPAVDEDE